MRTATAERLRRGLAALALALAACAGAQAQVDNFQRRIPAADVAQLQKARALRAAHDPAAAIKLLEPLVARQPGYFNAQYELGLAISDTPDTMARAIAPLERAAALKRSLPEIDDAHVLNSLGWAYLYTGQTARAEAVLKEAEAHLDQLDADVRRRLYNNLGTLYLNTGRRAEAEKYLRIAAGNYGSKQAEINLHSLDALNRRDARRAATQ